MIFSHDELSNYEISGFKVKRQFIVSLRGIPIAVCGKHGAMELIELLTTENYENLKIPNKIKMKITSIIGKDVE